jgi:hypothetical protein
LKVGTDLGSGVLGASVVAGFDVALADVEVAVRLNRSVNELCFWALRAGRLSFRATDCEAALFVFDSL